MFQPDPRACIIGHLDTIATTPDVRTVAVFTLCGVKAHLRQEKA